MEWNGMFQAISGHISKMVQDKAKVITITNKKWHTSRQTRWQSLTLNDMKAVTRYRG